MSFVSKMFLAGLCGIGLSLATSSQADAGFRHRQRQHGCCGTSYSQSSCAPAYNNQCGTPAYSAPAGCSNCQTGTGYGQPANGQYGNSQPANGQYGNGQYGNGQQSPMMAPRNSGSPSDLPPGSPPSAPDSVAPAPPPPAASN